MSLHHNGLFWLIWWKRHRIERDLKFRQQLLECRLAWRRRTEIQDLADPHGKRFLFGGSLEMAPSTFEGPEGL